MAKAQPGKLSYASSGNGVSNHLAMELFKQMAGVDLLHIPYRGDAPAMVDLLGGQVQVAFANMATAAPQLKNPKLRVIAVAANERLAILPDVPTIAESVPGYEMRLWYGIIAKAGTPPAIVDKLNAAVRTAQASPEIKQRLADIGSISMLQSQEEFQHTIRQDLQKWTQVVDRARITVD
jgi:tripartite-type tricarboxylate transporter receptor subunit TctC